MCDCVLQYYGIVHASMNVWSILRFIYVFNLMHLIICKSDFYLGFIRVTFHFVK